MKRTLLLSLALMSSFVNAQTLTLDDAIDKALHSHPDIQYSLIKVQKGASGIDIAKSDYLPQLNFYAEYDPRKTYVFPSNGVFQTKEDDGWSASLSLHQKIWDFSKTTANIAAKKESLEAAKLSLLGAKALLAYKVKLLYELMSVQKTAMQVRKKDLEAKSALYKQAQALVEQGMKTTVDASRFLSAVYSAQDTLAIAKANFDKARNSLSIYIGEAIEPDVFLDATYKSRNRVDKETILNNSPLLLSLKKSIKKSELTYKSLQASQYGSIDAIASYARIGSLNEYDSSYAGVTLSIPLYSGGKISASLEQAKLEQQSAQAIYNSKMLELKEEVDSTLIDIERYTKSIKAKKAQLDTASQTYNLLNARYSEGLATYIEVLDASSLKLSAELGLINTQYERSSALHKLEYLQGKI